jgi:cell division transport system permease protein
MRFSWFLKEAVTSLRRNWVMSIAAIVTVALSLFVVGLFFYAAITLNDLIGKYEKEVVIKVFLKDSADPVDVQKLQDEIVSWTEVEAVQYISKEEALERFKQQFGNRPELIENLPGNPLPASFEVRLKDPKLVETVAARFNGKQVVDQVDYGKDIVEKLFTAVSIVRYVGAFFVLLLTFVSMVLIVLTIRLAIYARRQEVAIMRLVGASNWFIRLPFVIEGCLQGILGAAIASGGIYLLKVSFFDQIRTQVQWLPLSMDPVMFWQITGGLLLGGLAIGALGSGIALRRFLKV